MCPRHFAVIFARVDFSEDEVAEVDRIPLEERDRVAFDCILSRYQTKTGGVAGKLRIKDEDCHDGCLIDGVETQSILR